MKTILITGATQGLGRELAQRLAKPGTRLLLHGRDKQRLDTVARQLGTIADVEVATYQADLGDLGQVRALAAEVLADETRLDVLVNNAGVGGGADASRREVSRDGHELRFAVNYLAPVTLSRALVPLLKASAPARIVNLASVGQAPIDFRNIMLERGYGGMQAYIQSKAALIMHTFDLAAELDGTGVTVNALHPASLMPTFMVKQSKMPVMSTLDEGVEPTLRLIESGDVAGITGGYFDQFTDTRALSQAYDLQARKQLRELTEELTWPR